MENKKLIVWLLIYNEQFLLLLQQNDDLKHVCIKTIIMNYKSVFMYVVANYI